LNDYFGDLIDAVISSGGDIVKFAGDALLAVWPAAGDDLAPTVQAAALCGQRAQQILRDRKTRDGETLSLRIGIGTGVVSTASVGGERNRWEFVVSGKPVREATIAAELAERGDVVLGPLAAKRAVPSVHGVGLSEGHLRLEGINCGPPLLPQPIPELEAEHEKKILGYIPGAIHSRLDSGHGNWLGELRRLTVLFINLPGLDHGTPLPIAQKVMLSLQTALYRFEGSVNKLSADDKGVTFVAALGLPPLAHEDDALRGVLVALDIKAALDGMGQQCSIGVTSGRVFCGIIGNQERCEYTMIGDVVNLSARLMQAARGGILCDQATFLGANRQIDFETLPPIPLKGKAEPQAVFRPRNKRRRAASFRPLAPIACSESFIAITGLPLLTKYNTSSSVHSVRLIGYFKLSFNK
jgi:class 3 adenylate cyclase